MQEAEKRKIQVEETLDTLKQGFEFGLISEDDYRQMKDENEKRLGDIKKQLKKLSEKDVEIEKQLTELSKKESGLEIEHSKIEKKIDHYKNIPTILDQRVDRVEDNFKELRREVFFLRGKYNSVSKINSTINKIEKSFSDFQTNHLEALDEKIRLTNDFFQVINLLPYVSNRYDIKEELQDLKHIIDYMKKKNIWDSEKKEFLVKFLKNLAQGWEAMKETRIAGIYLDEVKRLT